MRPEAFLARTRTALSAVHTLFPSSCTFLYQTPRQQQRTAQINGGGTCYTAPLSPRVAQISVRTYYCRRPQGGTLWTGRDRGRSERTSQPTGLTPSIAMDKYINRDTRRIGAELQQWPSRYVCLHHHTL
jgi:hypothetical protein